MNEGDIAKPLSGIDTRLTCLEGIFQGLGQWRLCLKTPECLRVLGQMEVLPQQQSI
jgi:hypothetical protein